MADVWAAVRDAAAGKAAVRAIIDRLTLLELDSTRAVVGCSATFVAIAQSKSAAVGSMARTWMLGVRPRATAKKSATAGDLDAPEHPGGSTAPTTPAPRTISAAERAGLGSPLRDHPLVRTAAELFSAKIVEVIDEPPAERAR